MFLYSLNLNEGGSDSTNNPVRKNELQEGEDPKAEVKNNKLPDGWKAKKCNSLVNHNWEKLRNSVYRNF